MLKMGTDLKIDIYNDLFIIYFFYKCKAKQLEFLTEKEFETGLHALDVYKFSDLKSKYKIYIYNLLF